jgi:hypothetical protein
MTALQVGQLAQRLYKDYTGFMAVMESALHPSALLPVALPEPGAVVGSGFIRRKKGEPHAYWHEHYLAQVLDSADEQREEVSRVWLSGALIRLGDALHDEGYFDHAPELELVRHMRNAVAHGNKFSFKGTRPKHPAHNGLAFIRGWDNDSEFSVDANLQGQSFLFDWMEPGDVLDVFLSVSQYLIRMGNGEYPLRSWIQGPDVS